MYIFGTFTPLKSSKIMAVSLKSALLLMLLGAFTILDVGAQLGSRRPRPRPDDCTTLRVRCEICVRSLHEGPNEENIMGRLNRRCQEAVGRKYVWRDLNRCDMAYLSCRALYSPTCRPFDCETFAQLSSMKLRLP